MKRPPIEPNSRRRRPPSTRVVAATVQLAIATTLAVMLVVAIAKFFDVADRLPGGARSYLYLPIAMGGFLILAVARMVKAWRSIRGRDRR